MEKIKASIRAKVEHPITVIKRQYGYTKVRYRGLKKNTLQLSKRCLRYRTCGGCDISCWRHRDECA